MLRTIEEDIVWPYERDNPSDFEVALGTWINDYNADFPHQALKNMAPKQSFETTKSKSRF